MQKRIFVLVFFLVIAGNSLTAALIPPFFLDCVVAIGYRPMTVLPGSDGKLAAQRGAFVPVASGFLYGQFREKIGNAQKSYGIYLVTNQHVLADVDRIEKQYIEQASKTIAVHETPAMFLRFNPKAAKPAQDFEVPIRNLPPRRDWAQDERLDLAVIPITPGVLDAAGIQYNYFRSDEHVADKLKAAEIGLTEGDGTYVLGFPMGLVGGERNFVISRQGTIARIRDFLAGAGNTFLIDALIFPGNSGGPVVSKVETNWVWLF